MGEYRLNSRGVWQWFGAQAAAFDSETAYKLRASVLIAPDLQREAEVAVRQAEDELGLERHELLLALDTKDGKSCGGPHGALCDGHVDRADPRTLHVHVNQRTSASLTKNVGHESWHSKRLLMGKPYGDEREEADADAFGEWLADLVGRSAPTAQRSERSHVTADHFALPVSKARPRTLETRALGFRLAPETKAASDSWAFSGYASTHDLDHVGDIVEPGAFAQSLKVRPRPRFLWSHQDHEPIGVTLELAEDGRGLLGRWKISETKRGRDAYTLLQDGAVDSLSIGFVPVRADYDTKNIRHLREVDLREVSLVSMPANEFARVTGKGATCEHH